ncbi:Clan SB, family S8, subtilisin-like serine peptidase [Trichomonas vaginalis G3]|uniref:Clan SB, family S8, subtilisin-like serine peptidase n=1 Tax=Trichomonas vaginalis (strain ATCC PRA-98 / G3) TaxID=412133 RepID=A2E9V8_TRIV3|nr:serine-type endopeptidase protein [Trichomonas vaginalis G3]EAY10520.1 Clan SB, family S8, subtilisin-like serine peptidase [Trichomonas vaginalis G3]KAI5551964.1 serine-type endopeptidase protein [Trichomonas vaginalis G3]|eukprot:XP_001322743.1 Clan SB, family S8, subtilisin-like serine peptidase [Trichomonas vaginalis G3]
MSSSRTDSCPFGISPNSTYSSSIIFQENFRVSTISRIFNHYIDEIDIQVNSWSIDNCDQGKCRSYERIPKIADALHNTSHGRHDKGQILLFAAGNDGEYLCDSNFQLFSIEEESMMISSTTNRGDRAFYSCRGTALICNTPSSLTSSIDLPEKPFLISTSNLSPFSLTEKFAGTSASAPIAAGVIALALQVNSNLTRRDIYYIIAMTSTKNDPFHFSWKKNSAGYLFSSVYGFGRINAGEMIEMAKKWNVVLPKQTKIFQQSYGNFKNGFCEIKFDISEDLFVETVSVDVSLYTMDYSTMLIDLISPENTISNIKTAAMIKEEGRRYNRSFLCRGFLGENAKGSWKLRIRTHILSDTNVFVNSTIKVSGTKVKPNLSMSTIHFGQNPFENYQIRTEILKDLPETINASILQRVTINNIFNKTVLIRLFASDFESKNRILLSKKNITRKGGYMEFYIPSIFVDDYCCNIICEIFEFNIIDAKKVKIQHGYNLPSNIMIYKRKYYHLIYNLYCKIEKINPEIMCSIYFANKSVSHYVYSNNGHILIECKTREKIEKIILTPVEHLDVTNVDYIVFDDVPPLPIDISYVLIAIFIILIGVFLFMKCKSKGHKVSFPYQPLI